MAYLFLGFALAFGLVKGFCGKKISNAIVTVKDSTVANLLRMSLCAVIGGGLILVGQDLSYLAIETGILWIVILSAIGSAAFVVTWLLAVKNGSYILVNIFIMLGVIVPMLGSYILVQEPIYGRQWFGFILLLAAVLVMCSYNNGLKAKLNVWSILNLILCGLSSGIADLMQKLFVKQAAGVPISVFNFYTYLFSAAILLVVVLCVKQEEDARGRKMTIRTFFFIALMAISLFANSYFKTLAAIFIPSAQLYPLNQGLNLILAAIMVDICFGEKITRKSLLGMGLAFVGIVIINL